MTAPARPGAAVSVTLTGPHVRAAHLALAAETRARMAAAEAAADAAERARAAVVRARSSVADRLTDWAGGRARRERAAVLALVAEGTVLERAEVRDLFVVQDPTTGTASCDWERLTRWLYYPTISREDRAFLYCVLSLAGRAPVVLGALVPELGKRRAAILLSALGTLAGTCGT
ncbi:hypothetical protein [Streptomyces fragilis]|uniref:Uncharacterized protein n=1 Tax=Streptomyces fragilis TaxID=67301 RepID=A0ABV2YEG4_9ACTN|nr:hypothetical protein [Streptomyces fragilis]